MTIPVRCPAARGHSHGGQQVQHEAARLTSVTTYLEGPVPVPNQHDVGQRPPELLPV